MAEFLIENFHIDPKQVVAVGFGEEKLKNPENPLAAENRRVQVVNMASKDVAAKAGALMTAALTIRAAAIRAAWRAGAGFMTVPPSAVRGAGF